MSCLRTARSNEPNTKVYNAISNFFPLRGGSGGNSFEGNQDAFSGLLLTIAKEGFNYEEFPTLGFEKLGHATDVKKIKVKGEELILVAQNNNQLIVFKREDKQDVINFKQKALMILSKRK